MPQEDLRVTRVSSSRTCVASAATAISFGLTLLLLLLHRNGLWIDELYTLNAVSLSWGEMVAERLSRGHFPLYFAVIKAVVAMADGASETVLRLPSVVAWFMACMLFVGIAMRQLRPRAAAVAVVLFSLNGLALRNAAEARMYTFVLLFAVTVASAYFSLLRDGSGRKLQAVLLIVATLLGVWTSTSFLFIVGALVVDSWSRRRTNARLFRVVLSALVISVITLVPGAIFHEETRDQNTVAKVRPQYLVSHVITFVSGVLGDQDYYRATVLLRAMQVVGGVVAVLVLSDVLRRRRVLPDVDLVALRVLFLPMLLMLITWVADKVSGHTLSLLGPARYMMGALPFAVLLAGTHVDSLLAGLRLPWQRWLFVLGCACVCLNAFAILTIRTEPFRECVRYLNEHASREDGLVVVPRQIKAGVDMYAPRLGVDVSIDRWETDSKTIARDLSALRGRDTVWFLWYRGRFSSAVDVARHMFGPYISSSRKHKLGTLRVLRFTPAAYRSVGTQDTSSTISSLHFASPQDQK